MTVQRDGASAPFLVSGEVSLPMQIEVASTKKALADAMSSMAVAAKGVQYIKNEFKDTAAYDHNQMFEFISKLLSNKSLVNAMVMSGDPVILSSMQYFVSWYVEYSNTSTVPDQLKLVLASTHSIDRIPLLTADADFPALLGVET